ncbi:PHP domain-containing protein [Coprobacillaceae bacterium CR2/5/TPMF4]|nr:PHP domain-containing protein [Coprobacillaceae bacterium CR2/5/TPMF4]
MYYDLHIHSALSPCGDDLMTINNIFNMAYIKGLDLIAITDHNSLKQQHYLSKIIEHDVLKGKLILFMVLSSKYRKSAYFGIFS